MPTDTLVVGFRAWFNKIKPFIRVRDGNACVRCGNSHVEQLHTHHIEPWGTDPLTLWFEPSNLATVCNDCHKAAHLGRLYDETDPVIATELRLKVGDRRLPDEALLIVRCLQQAGAAAWQAFISAFHPHAGGIGFANGLSTRGV
jgi:hypothetical protein